jgi:hypothetical protein
VVGRASCSFARTKEPERGTSDGDAQGIGGVR